MDDHLCATKKEKILKILLNTERGKLGNVVPFSLTLPVHWGHWVQGRDSIRTTAALHAVHHSSSKLQDHKKTKLYQHFGFNCAGTAHPAFLIRAHDGVGQKEVQWAPNETEESSGHSVCVSFLNFLTSPQQHLWYYVSHFSSYTVSCTTAYNLAHPLAEPKPWGPSGWRTPFNTGSKGIKSRPICSLYSAGCAGFKKCSLTHQDKEGNMLI